MHKSLARYYRRIYFHRTVITEGIRLAVRRNNNHMYRIQSALGSSLVPGRKGLDQVLNQILADQGVARNQINRGVLPLATWIPWEVYLCLLSAEVDAYRHASKAGQVPLLDEFDDFLKPTSQEPRPRGRPPLPMPKIDATPEQVARAIFSAVKKPDPSIRVTRRRENGKEPR